MTTPLLELKSKHIRALEILHVRGAPVCAVCMRQLGEALASARGGQTKLQENVALRAEVESMEQASKQELSAELERLRAELSAKHEYELEAVSAPSARSSRALWLPIDAFWSIATDGGAETEREGPGAACTGTCLPPRSLPALS